ncbi:S8 family serine peptidase [Flammeovirga sp. MY04]|uniref:S8 family serine peptidase n=1 Tax=Flammeovirga sp. MY04 TaxID=1191459 RepID=UPI00080626AA|nr:S8 family serine peptidase [Flammeovirga sp. MY04]ANQ52828.1 S8 family serine peptidase [Flammeovirga sp. MY04]
MKKIYNLIILSLFLCIGSTAFGQTPEVVPGKIRVKFSPSMVRNFRTIDTPDQDTRVDLTGVTQIDAFNTSQQIDGFKRVFPFSLKNEAKHRAHGLHLWYEISFDEVRSPAHMVESYQILDGVEIAKPVYKKSYIEPAEFIPYTPSSNQRVQNSYPFDDPFLKDQWHYENYGDIIGEADADIDLFKAWEKTTGSSDVIVAIIDGGMDVAHDDLKDAMWVNEAEANGEPGVDDDQNGYVDDINGYNFVAGGNVSATDHGSHVGGTVAATNNNGIGVGGVAGGDGTEGSGARLMSCQIFLQSGSSTGVANAFVYAADNGAVIAQNSWSYTSTGYYEQEVLDAIDYFIEEAGQYEGSPMKGGIVFFSAGNTGYNQEIWPGMYEKVYTVAASDASNNPTEYTTHGTHVDILAPGGSLFNVQYEGVLSTVPGNQYAFMQGTSMACPHVSGVAALVLSEFGGEDFTPEDLKQRIIDFSQPFDDDMHEYWNGLVGRGMLNAVNALSVNSDQKPETPVIKAENVYHDSFDVTWKVPYDADDEQPNAFYVWFSQLELTEDNYESISPYVFESSVNAGETFRLTIGNTREKQDFYFIVKAVDKWGNESDRSNILKITTGEAPRLVLEQDSIILEIDVQQQEMLTENIIIKNTKGGILKWSAYAKNFGYIPEESLDEYLFSQNYVEDSGAKIAFDADGMPTITLHQPDTNKEPAYASPNNQGVMANIGEVPLERHPSFDTLKQIGEYRSGLQYDWDEWPGNALGVDAPEIMGFSHATVFEINRGLTFNLTHVAAFVNTVNTEEPIVVEIRKGGIEGPTYAETIHTQDFYVRDSTLGWIEIPLTRNFRFENDEVFWVVMHHPTNDPFPITCNLSGTYPGDVYWVSRNSGRTFENAQYRAVWLYYYLKVRALSTGNDGAWVYMDPHEGEVGPHKDETPSLKIDPSGLINGLHKSVVGLYTNDPNYPAASVFVDVTVKGQTPYLDVEDIYHLDQSFVGVEQYNELHVANNGYGNLEIYDYTSDIDGLELIKNDEDTLFIYAREEVNLAVNYTPQSLGMHQGYITLNTNIGDVKLLVTAQASSPAIATVKNVNLNTTVNYEDEDEVELSFTLENTGDYPLTYRIPSDLYDKYEGNQNDIRELFSEGHYPIDEIESPRRVTSIYTEITSDDLNGPMAGAFEDISTTGTPISHITLAYATAYGIEMGFDFPYFDGVFDKININAEGVMSFGQLWTTNADFSFPMANKAEGGIALMWHGFDPIRNFQTGVKRGEIYYESKGDRFIVQYHKVIQNNREGEMTIQAVLFADGTIEFRYKDIETSNFYDKGLIGIQNIEEDYGITFQARAQDNVADGYVSPLKDDFVIRYERHEDKPFVKMVTPKEGTLLKGESTDIKLTVNHLDFNLTDGDHLNKLFIFNNGTDPYQEVEVNLTVIGEEDVTLNVDELNFEAVTVNDTLSLELSVDNAGSKGVEITQVDLPEYILSDIELPYWVAPQSENKFFFSFAPLTKVTKDDVATITLSNGEELQVDIKGFSLESPRLAFDNAPVHIELNAGEIKEMAFEIENNSNDQNLWYSILPKNILSVLGLEDYTRESADTLSFDYGVTDTQDDPSAYLGYSYESIVKEENRIHVSSDAYQGVKLPFKFWFYGEEYDSAWMNEHGYISIVPPELSTNNTHPLFVKDDLQKGLIAPHWALFTLNKVVAESGLYYQAFDDKAVFEWHMMVHQQGEVVGGAATFQAILHKNGQIEFLYDDVDTYNGEFNFGIESPDERFVIDLGRNEVDWEAVYGQEFDDHRRILITPPAKGFVRPNAREEFTIQLAGSMVFDGHYEDTLWVVSNSMFEDSVSFLPLEIDVYGEASPEIAEMVNFDTLFYIEEEVFVQPIILKNIGTKSYQLDKILYDDDNGLEVQYADGKKIFTSGTGQIYDDIIVAPQSEDTLYVAYAAETLTDVNEVINWEVNGREYSTMVKAVMIDPPVLHIPTEDVTIEVTDQETMQHQISVVNNGNSPLNYQAEVIYRLTEGQKVEHSEDITFADSLLYDYYNNTNKAQGYWASLGGMPTSVASKHKAPEAGFLITHVRSNVDYINNGVFTVRIEIVKGGADPVEGERVAMENFTQEFTSGEKWILLPFENPVYMDPNEEYWIVVHHPPGYFKVGFDLDYSKDFDFDSQLTSFDGGDFWGYDPDQPRIWKTRALSATALTGWFTMDTYSGTVAAGDNEVINTNIDFDSLRTGNHLATVRFRSNDPMVNYEDVNFLIKGNVAPEFTYTPDQFGKIFVDENDSKVFNIMASDFEKSALRFSVDSAIDFIEVKHVNDSIAQLIIEPTFEHQGDYEVEVNVEDEWGGNSTHSLILGVNNVNRAPIVTPFSELYMNASRGDLKMISLPNNITDLDEDVLGYFVQNFHPDIVEVAYGDDEAIIIPKEEGVAVLAYGADDFNGGFSYEFIYVIVEGSINSIDGTEQLTMKVYPNPTTSMSHLQMRLPQASEVEIQLFNIQGQKVKEVYKDYLPSGEHQISTDLNALRKGMYIYKVFVDSYPTEAIKIIKE